MIIPSEKHPTWSPENGNMVEGAVGQWEAALSSSKISGRRERFDTNRKVYKVKMAGATPNTC